MERLEGKKIAVLVTNGFEQIELTKPVEGLKEAGAKVDIVSPENTVKGWNVTDWGDVVKADILLDNADPEEYDCLVLPGGVLNPDKLRMNDTAVKFVRHFTSSNKPIASICHGPWTLIETGFVNGKKLTSYSSIKTDLVNAGAHWVNEAVVVDGNLVTSRQPDDLPAFVETMVNVFEKSPEKIKA